jgi:hypothetical protein
VAGGPPPKPSDGDWFEKENPVLVDGALPNPKEVGAVEEPTFDEPKLDGAGVWGVENAPCPALGVDDPNPKPPGAGAGVDKLLAPAAPKPKDELVAGAGVEPKLKPVVDPLLPVVFDPNENAMIEGYVVVIL